MPYTIYPDGHMVCDTVDEAVAWLNAWKRKQPIKSSGKTQHALETITAAQSIYRLRKVHRYVLALVVEFNPVTQRGITNTYGLCGSKTSRALNYLKRKGLVVDTRSGNGKNWKAAAHVSKAYPEFYDAEKRKQVILEGWKE